MCVVCARAHQQALLIEARHVMRYATNPRKKKEDVAYAVPLAAAQRCRALCRVARPNARRHHGVCSHQLFKHAPPPRHAPTNTARAHAVGHSMHVCLPANPANASPH